MRSVGMAAFLEPISTVTPEGIGHTTVSACACLYICMCVPLTANGEIGVTACLLGNRLTNNLLKGIRDMKKMEDQLCLSFYRTVSLHLVVFSLFSAGSSVPCSCSALILFCCTLAFHHKILLAVAPLTCTQMLYKVSMHGDVERGDRTHAQTHSISDTNAAATLLAVRSDLRCSLDKPLLLLLQGLLQVQGGVSNTAAVSVVVGLRWAL